MFNSHLNYLNNCNGGNFHNSFEFVEAYSLGLIKLVDKHNS